MPPHSARPTRKPTRSCGKTAARATIQTAPTTVPIKRYQPLRSEAPRCGWHTKAADVPAQKAWSSSSQNATYRARQTEANKRNPNTSRGATAQPAFSTASQSLASSNDPGAASGLPVSASAIRFAPPRRRRRIGGGNYPHFIQCKILVAIHAASELPAIGAQDLRTVVNEP